MQTIARTALPVIVDSWHLSAPLAELFGFRLAARQGGLTHSRVPADPQSTACQAWLALSPGQRQAPPPVASRLVRRGASLKEVADFLGHRSLDTTAIYAKLDLVALRDVALPWPAEVAR
jgi:integrase